MIKRSMSTEQSNHFDRSNEKPKGRIYNMRCPSCAKLYKVDSKDLLSENPHFECQFCKTEFTFDNPPSHPHSVTTRPLRQTQLSPKFSKMGDLDFVNSQKKSSLARAWQELLNDYDNIKKHIAFVDRCEDLQAIPYALKKYEALREAQPQDEVAKKMFERVWFKSLSRQADKMAEVSRLKYLFHQVNWPRVAKISPWVLYALMVVVGLASKGLRNMVGIGVALIFLHLGLQYFIKGRIAWDDFY